MAQITSVVLIDDNLQEDEWGRLKAMMKFKVESDSYMTTDAAMAAAAAKGLPARRKAYSATRPFCRCVLRTPERKSNTLWEMSCYFEDPTSYATGNPLAEPAQIDSGVEMEQEEREYDGRGNPVRTKSKQRFSRPPTFPTQTALYSVTKIVNDATKALIKAAANSTNAAQITIDGDTWGIGEAWLVLGQKAFTKYVIEEGGIETNYWVASYVIRGKRGGWKKEVANIANVNLAGKTPKEVIAGVTINPPMGWPLDDNGAFRPNHSDDPTKLTFWDAEEGDWTGVPLS